MKNKQKVSIDEVIVEGYYFTATPGLYWHSGSFWYNDLECKKVVNNGSLSILVNGSKKSIKQLRKQAQPCTIKIEKYKIPF